MRLVSTLGVVLAFVLACTAAPDSGDSGAVETTCPAETCNGVDDDCDGTVDNNVADVPVWFADDDGDGFGDAEEFTEGCEAPGGFVADDTDCDDANPSINPGVEEDGGNEVDENCDAVVDETCGSHAPVIGEITAEFDPAYEFSDRTDPATLIHFEFSDEDGDVYRIKIRAWNDFVVDGVVDTSGDPQSTFNTITLDDDEECDYGEDGMLLSFGAENVVGEYPSMEWAISVSDALNNWSEPAVVEAPLE